MFFAIGFDAKGAAISRLEYSEEQPVLPAGQVACTREQHDNHTSYKLENGQLVMHSPATLLAQAKTARIAAIRAACIEEVSQLAGECDPGDWVSSCNVICAKRIDLIDRVNATTDIDAVKTIVW